MNLLSLSWSDFLQLIRNQDGRKVQDARYSPLPVLHSNCGRWTYCDELETCLTYFAQYANFAAMPNNPRQHVADTLPPDTDRWFGWMSVAGRFKELVNCSPQTLGQWLDPLPKTGRLTVGAIQRSLQGLLGIDGVGPATATRLLAMKRPERCMPITSTNHAQLSVDPALRQYCPPLKVDGPKGPAQYATRYLDFLDQVWKSPWWKTPAPSTNTPDFLLWRGRVALLDTIFYDP